MATDGLARSLRRKSKKARPETVFWPNSPARVKKKMVSDPVFPVFLAVFLEQKKKNYHLTERSFGSVRRSFRVPEGIDVSKIKADFAKGVLQVTLPKTKEAKAKQRKIPVRAS